VLQKGGERCGTGSGSRRVHEVQRRSSSFELGLKVVVLDGRGDPLGVLWVDWVVTLSLPWLYGTSRVETR
jgi:hypothetical protein